ncbi:helix-hairpin-helix domain-containing protein [Halomicroarcula sp. GCM10025709]|uniref:helix-hairpin-helix domain-containing protein n=1 Tax=Haloarcula TaxID=2237 RepID=UPI0024C3867F|nr:helix-hairpin-helix domain-containing protein [Halomicroarcula sp. YJ-61-S]
MGLLQKLKSALGLDGAESATGASGSGDVDVTVEREPATESEDAVKGTETAASGTDVDQGAETAAESAESEDAAAEPEGSGDDVTAIKGIGPAYADRLSGIGIETVGELAVADADDIAAQTDLSESRVSGWIERAREY